jgi:hypothetical protein
MLVRIYAALRNSSCWVYIVGIGNTAKYEKDAKGNKTLHTAYPTPTFASPQNGLFDLNQAFGIHPSISSPYVEMPL